MSKNKWTAEEALKDLNMPLKEGISVGLNHKLHEKQIEALQSLYKDKKSLVFIASGRKFGKMIDLDTDILTPSGFRRYGDMVEGDELYDEQGKIQKIVQCHPIDFSPKSYKVTFRNGEVINACSDHLWLTYTKQDRRHLKRNKDITPIVKTTEDIKNTLTYCKEYNHTIPVTKHIEFPENKLDLDPYVLGLWLGDGSSHSAQITSADKEILLTLENKGFPVKHSRNYDYGVRNLHTHLNKLNLIKNKHIPKEYLFTHSQQRLELLQGLMDTDGTINKEGSYCCFDNTNKDIAEGVFYLVASLGMRPKWSSRMGKLYGVEKKRCYRVMFRPTVNVFKLSRKAELLKLSTTKNLMHTIISVEEIPSRPMRCITVTGKSHLYLVGKSLIPTHNTQAACYVLWRHALLNPNSACYYIAPEGVHGRKIVWDKRRLQNFLGPASKKYIKEPIHNMSMKINLHNGSFIQVIGSENWEAANGLDPNIAVYDEFKAFNPKWHVEFSPNLIAHAAPLVIIGTQPKIGDTNKREYEALLHYAKTHDHCAVHIYTSYDNPIISRHPARLEALNKEIAALRARGEEDVVQREFYSVIVPGGNKSIFPMVDDKVKIDFTSLRSIVLDASKNKNRLKWMFCVYPNSVKGFHYVLGTYDTKTNKGYIIDSGSIVNAAGAHTVPFYNFYEKNIKKYSEHIYAYCSSKQHWFSDEMSSNFGVGINLVEDAENSDLTISVARDMFSDGSLKISDKCTKLFKELQEYAKDNNDNLPKDGFDILKAFFVLMAEFRCWRDSSLMEEKTNIERQFWYPEGSIFQYDEKDYDWTNNFNPDFDL